MQPAPHVSRSLRSVAVVALVLVAAFFALTKNATGVTPSQSGSAISLAAATTSLVDGAIDAELASRATGGYVPGVGMVLTVELDELRVDEIDRWSEAALAVLSTSEVTLPKGEEVIFLLDIARPNRTSRLVSINPAELDASGSLARREAPALSTAPLIPAFDDEPGG